MITRSEWRAAQRRAEALFEEAGIVLTPEERAHIEVADFGLSDLQRQGLELVTYVNTERVCAKELALFPRQTCPEHRHPAVDGAPGKEETFRCRWGEVFLFVPGPPADEPGAHPPVEPAENRARGAYSVFHQIHLRPGDQYTIYPDTPHWFQAGDQGAVVSEFSTRSRDEFDIFTDPAVERATEIRE